MASQITAHPDLSSPPSTVVPSVRMMSPSTTGLTPSPGTTVSMCAHSSSGEPRPGRRYSADQIAGVAADALAGAIVAAGRAQRLELAAQPLGDLALLARERIDLDQFEQQVLEPLLIHGCHRAPRAA